MPALDVIHHAVKNARIKDGWTITDDPYTLRYGADILYVDLAAERRLAAERDGVKIAVEIESFVRPSPLLDFELALGQYMLYSTALEKLAPERKLFLAVTDQVFKTLFQRELIESAIQRFRLALVIVALEAEEVVQWIN
ncbi:MAG: XisH family protein [Chloroflexi bacterium]|nr:XisH family protein [Chloroflexota bacterium]